MSISSHKIVRLFVVNRQVCFVIAVLLAPVLILHLMTNASMRAMQKHQDFTVSRDYPSLDLAYMQTSTEEMVKKADDMTPDQYAKLLQTNPQLPKTLDAYRHQMKARLHQLNKMTEDELAEQMNQITPPLPRAEEGGANTALLPQLEQQLKTEQGTKAGTSNSTKDTSK